MVGKLDASLPIGEVDGQGAYTAVTLPVCQDRAFTKISDGKGVEMTLLDELLVNPLHQRGRVVCRPFKHSFFPPLNCIFVAADMSILYQIKLDQKISLGKATSKHFYFLEGIILDSNKEIEAMLEREQHVLTIIQEHMKKLLDSRATYIYDMGKDYAGIQTELFQSFWDECIEKYQDEIEHYCMDYTGPTEIYNDDGSSGDDNPSNDGNPSSVPPDSKNMSEPDNEDEDNEAGNVILIDPLEQLDEVFSSVCNYIYLGSIPSEKCNKLYKELLKQLEKDMIRSWKPPKVNFSIRKTALARLPRILDLRNQDICSMLPYLMTAYTCSPSRFLYEKNPCWKRPLVVLKLKSIHFRLLRCERESRNFARYSAFHKQN